VSDCSLLPHSSAIYFIRNPTFKTATFLEIGRDDGHLALLPANLIKMFGLENRKKIKDCCVIYLSNDYCTADNKIELKIIQSINDDNC
jgi:hypothetical protein